MKLDDLYVYDMEITGISKPDDEEYNFMLEKEHKLRESLSQEQLKFYEEFMDSFIKFSGKEELELYKKAFASGVRVTAEAFVLETSSPVKTAIDKLLDMLKK